MKQAGYVERIFTGNIKQLHHCLSPVILCIHEIIASSLISESKADSKLDYDSETIIIIDLRHHTDRYYGDFFLFMI